jgi:hypothetical protein
MAFDLAAGSAGAPPAPPAPMQPPAPKMAAPMRTRMSERSDDKKKEADSTVDATPYLDRLRQLADQLANAVNAPVPAAAAQLPAARLGELLEDLRSVGLDELARRLAPIVDRLRLALSATEIATILGEVATALRTLLPGPGGDGGGKRKRGLAFWR